MASILMDDPIYIQRVEVAPAEKCIGDRIKILFKGDKHINFLITKNKNGELEISSRYFVPQ